MRFSKAGEAFSAVTASLCQATPPRLPSPPKETINRFGAITSCGLGSSAALARETDVTRTISAPQSRGRGVVHSITFERILPAIVLDSPPMDLWILCQQQRKNRVCHFALWEVPPKWLGRGASACGLKASPGLPKLMIRILLPPETFSLFFSSSSTAFRFSTA